MWGSTCIPRKVYQVLYPLKRHFRCAQGQHFPHSTEFSGGACHRSSKASRRENLEIEQPIVCWDFSSFHFHPTLAGMLGSTLIRNEVV